MAKYTTNNNTEFKNGKGNFFRNLLYVTGAGATISTITDIAGSARKYTTSSGKEYNIPSERMWALEKKEINKLINETESKGRKLTRNEILDIVGGNVAVDNKLAFYDYLLDQNADTFGFDSTGKKLTGYNQSGEPIYENTSNSSTDFYSMLGQQRQELKDSMMLSSNDANAQQYKQDMYGSLDAYESELDASLAASEMSAYKQLGQQQLELENTIAEQRMKALKSGTTSAQLASQQLANMFAAQSGAAQVASNLYGSRLQNANTIAQSRYGITQSMYDMINQNRQTLATADAQYAATLGNYAATIDQPYAQYNAYASLSRAQQEAMNTQYSKTK